PPAVPTLWNSRPSSAAQSTDFRRSARTSSHSQLRGIRTRPRRQTEDPVPDRSEDLSVDEAIARHAHSVLGPCCEDRVGGGTLASSIHRHVASEMVGELIHLFPVT